MIKIFVFSKKYTLVPKLSYKFYKKLFIRYDIIFLKIFPIYSQISKTAWNDGDSDVYGDGENFFIGKCCENEMA